MEKLLRQFDVQSPIVNFNIFEHINFLDALLLKPLDCSQINFVF